jgi:hypothetical protein
VVGGVVLGYEHWKKVTRAQLQMDEMSDDIASIEVIQAPVQELMQKNEAEQNKNKELMQEKNELMDKNKKLWAELDKLKASPTHKAADASWNEHVNSESKSAKELG